MPTQTIPPTAPSLPCTADLRLRAIAAARRLLGCDHLAEDVVQEALIVLWQQPSAPTDVAGWFVRAVVHRARHLRRSLLRRHHHEACVAAHCALHDDCDNPLHHAHAHELEHRLAVAKATLPTAQSLVLDLQLDTGLDYQGIAERLELPIGTVRSRLHRARAVLSAAVRDDERGPAARRRLR